MRNVNDFGVSPVVGVMLMLVVTIIIAAVVSAFGGGIAVSDEQPSMTFDGKLSVSNGMVLTHTGGDTIPTSKLNIQLRPGESFGYLGSGISSAGSYSADVVNKTTVTDVDGTPIRSVIASGMGAKTTWSGGESLYILPPYHNRTFLQPSLGDSSLLADYEYAQATNIGRTIIVELIDDEGHLFASNEISIVA